MTRTCNRRLFLAGVSGLLVGPPVRRAGARQPAEDVPGLEEGAFTSNFYDHEIAWTNDWAPDLFHVEVMTADAFEHLELEDQHVPWNEGPTQVQFYLEQFDDGVSAEEYVNALPDDYAEEQGYGPEGRIYDRGANQRGGWLIYGRASAEDGSNAGGATVAQFLLPRAAGDPLLTIEVNVLGDQVKKSVLRRIDEEIELDGESIFIVEDLDTLWDVIHDEL